jgi:hypothetical protein
MDWQGSYALAGRKRLGGLLEALPVPAIAIERKNERSRTRKRLRSQSAPH